MAKVAVDSPAPFWDVVIAGGSLSGLLYGIAFKRQGRSVCILEQATTRTSTAAGIGIGPYGQKFLEQYDLVKTPFWYHIDGSSMLDTQGKFKFKAKRGAVNMTSWDALYYRLRANFDGYDNGYCASPQESPNVGHVQYSSGKRVTGFEVVGDTVRVKYQDAQNQDAQEAIMETSLLIGADGINSTIRKILAPGVELHYSGFVAWRGTVPELEVSAEAREAFTGLFNCPVPGGGYIVAYAIPGEKGALDVGSRDLNVVWYSEVSREELNNILVDSDGYRHKTTLPKGKMQAQVWAEQLQKGSKLFRPYREVCEKIEQPFISTVNDYMAPKVSWYGGKVVLAGEASCLLRPNIGASFETAAFAMLEFIKGEKSWESSVRHNNYKVQALAKTFGEFSLYGLRRLSVWWNIFKLISVLISSPLKRFIY